MNKAQRSVDKFTVSTGTLVRAAAGIGIAMGLAIKQTIEFESAFTGVRKTVELTEAGFKDLENRFKKLSTEIPISFVELSKIGELAGQLGVSGVDNLEKFTRTIADISRTTNLTAESAATDFARISNIMQEPIDNVDRLGSVTVALGNNLATTEQEITNFALRIAAAGKISGINSAEILAIGAAFSSVGVQAERGGTAVNKVLINMTEAIAEGGDKLELFARTAGLTTLEFKDMFEKDAAGAFELFVRGLGTAGDEAFSILENLGLADQRLVQSFLALANAGDLITDAFRLANDEFTTNTALTEEASKRYETLESQLTIVKNTLKALGAEFGTIFAPEVQKGVSAIQTFLNFLRELDPATQTLVVRMTEVTGAVIATALAWRGWQWLGRFIPRLAKGGFVLSGAMILLEFYLKKVGASLITFAETAIGVFANIFGFIVNTGAIAVEGFVNQFVDGINFIIRRINNLRGRIGLSMITELSRFSMGRMPVMQLPVTEGVQATPSNLSSGQAVFNIAIENIFGQDPEQVSRALSEELNNKISII